jgi:uncharacterized protein (DUF433 family)
MTRLDRVTIDAEVCHGKPCIRGLRYPVEVLLDLLASGMTFPEILDDYEDLETDDLLAAIHHGARRQDFGPSLSVPAARACSSASTDQTSSRSSAAIVKV